MNDKPKMTKVTYNEFTFTVPGRNYLVVKIEIIKPEVFDHFLGF